MGSFDGMKSLEEERRDEEWKKKKHEAALRAMQEDPSGYTKASIEASGQFMSALASPRGSVAPVRADGEQERQNKLALAAVEEGGMTGRNDAMISGQIKQTGMREGGMNERQAGTFKQETDQNALGRGHQTTERLSEQDWRTKEATAGRTHASSESAADRAARLSSEQLQAKTARDSTLFKGLVDMSQPNGYGQTSNLPGGVQRRIAAQAGVGAPMSEWESGAAGGSGGVVATSAVPPTNPKLGQKWTDPADGTILTFDGKQWVE